MLLYCIDVIFLCILLLGQLFLQNANEYRNKLHWHIETVVIIYYDSINFGVVEVSELFKPTSTQKVVSGYLECDGRIVKVDSLDAVKRFVAEVEAK